VPPAFSLLHFGGKILFMAKKARGKSKKNCRHNHFYMLLASIFFVCFPFTICSFYFRFIFFFGLLCLNQALQKQR